MRLKHYFYSHPRNLGPLLNVLCKFNFCSGSKVETEQIVNADIGQEFPKWNFLSLKTIFKNLLLVSKKGHPFLDSVFNIRKGTEKSNDIPGFYDLPSDIWKWKALVSIVNARKLNCFKISLAKGDTRSEYKCAKFERLLISQGIKHVQSYQ